MFDYIDSDMEYTQVPTPRKTTLGRGIIMKSAYSLMVLINQKRGGLNSVSFVLRFSNKSVRARPVRGIKLLSEYMNTLFFPINIKVFMKKSGKLACSVQTAIPLIQTYMGFVPLIEKI